MFGAGFVGGEDRLFFMDVLRNLGRGRLSSFAGGANREMDRDQWLQTPYTEADLQRQVDQLDDLYGAEGRKIQEDVAAYVDGINAHIAAAKSDPLLLPAEYAAIGRPGGPEPWTARDVIATAALVGGIFGKGGGSELESALSYQQSRRRFGKRRGARIWRDFRAAEDPEAPTTVHRKRFPYQPQPKRVRKGSVALPDRGSVKRSKAVAGASGSAASAAGSGRPARRPARLPHLELQRAAGVGARVRVRQADRGDGAPDRLLRTADPDGARHPRARHRRPRRLLPRREPLRAAGPWARLRLLGHLGGPGHHRHLRRAAVQPGRRAPVARVHGLSLPRPLPADRGAQADEHLAVQRRRRHPAGQRDAHGRAHEARNRDRAGHDQGQARALHQASLHLPARGGLRARLRGLQRPGHHAQRLRLQARGQQDRLHVQLVLRRRPRHRLLQLGQQPGALQARGPEPAHPRPLPVAALQRRRQHGRLHRLRPAPQRAEPVLPHQLEQQAGARLPGLRRQLRVHVDLPLRAAGRPHPGEDPRRRQDEPAPAGGRDGDRRRGGRASRQGAALRAAGAWQPPARPGGTGRDLQAAGHGAAPARCARTPTATASTSTPRPSGSSTRGGRSSWTPSSRPCSASRCSIASSRSRRSTTTPTTTATTWARPTRAAPTAWSRRTSARCWAGGACAGPATDAR